MRNLLRRIRGTIGTGLTWAAAWAAVGFVPRWVLGINNGDVPYPIVFGALGFIAGVTFSGLLMLTEGRRRFDQMSLSRFAAAGATGGVLLAALLAGTSPKGWGDLLLLAPMLGAAGAVCASGSLALARRAERRELLPDAEAAPAKLTGREREKVLSVRE